MLSLKRKERMRRNRRMENGRYKNSREAIVIKGDL